MSFVLKRIYKRRINDRSFKHFFGRSRTHTQMDTSQPSAYVEFFGRFAGMSHMILLKNRY